MGACRICSRWLAPCVLLPPFALPCLVHLLPFWYFIVRGYVPLSHFLFTTGHPRPLACAPVTCRQPCQLLLPSVFSTPYPWLLSEYVVSE